MPTGFGSCSPVRANSEQLRVNALFKGGGAAADCVIQTTGHKIVKSLAYNAATGTFQLNLYDWPGVLVGFDVAVCPAAGAIVQQANLDIANVDKVNFTIPVYFKTLATDVAAAAAVDPLTTTYITLELVFQKEV